MFFLYSALSNLGSLSSFLFNDQLAEHQIAKL